MSRNSGTPQKVPAASDRVMGAADYLALADSLDNGEETARKLRTAVSCVLEVEQEYWSLQPGENTALTLYRMARRAEILVDYALQAADSIERLEEQFRGWEAKKG